MKKLSKLSALVGSFLVAGMISCSGPQTAVTGSWENNMAVQEYKHIAVASLIQDQGTKSVIENEIKEELQDEGVNASAENGSITDQLVKDEAQKSEILQQINQEGKDAIMTISVIASDTETRYVPGTTVYDPVNTFGYYNNFWGYYDNVYPMVYDPGYYTVDQVYYLETNLYDAKTEELVWSAQSETYNPTDLQEFADDFAEDIVEHLEDSDIID